MKLTHKPKSTGMIMSIVSTILFLALALAAFKLSLGNGGTTDVEITIMNEASLKRLISKSTVVKDPTPREGKTNVIGKTGGSLSWRNNNPGNLRFIYRGVIGDGHNSTRTKADALVKANTLYNNSVVGLDNRGLAIFRTMRDGEGSLEELLMRKFGSLTIPQAMKMYIGGNPTEYRDYMKAILSHYPNKKDIVKTSLEEMTYVEFKTLVMCIEKHEGFKEGNKEGPDDGYKIYLQRFALKTYKSKVNKTKRSPRYYNADHKNAQKIRRGLVQYAEACIGSKYVYGASRAPLKTDKRFHGGTFKPVKGMSHDCSSLIVRGVKPWINIPWSTSGLRKYVKKHGNRGLFNIVRWKDRIPGDIYLFKYPHIGVVENRALCIEAKGEKQGVVRIKANKINKDKIAYVLRFKG